MGRLIDADALLRRMEKDPLFDLVERYGVSGVIEAEPTVDAVPVEFIKSRIERLKQWAEESSTLNGGYASMADMMALELSDLLDRWAEKNETD